MSDTHATDIYSEIEAPYYSMAPLHEGVQGPTVNLTLPKNLQTTPFAKLVCETKLPQCVRITKNFLAPGSHSRFKKGDVFLLHFVYVKPFVHAIDIKTGQALRLPLYARQEFEILPLDPQLDDKEYDGTASLIDAKPLPKVVRVVDAHWSPRQDEQQSSDDIINIDKIEIDKERGMVLVGSMSNPLSQHSSPVRFSREMTASSYTTMIFTEFHRLSQLKTHKFPQRVRIPDITSHGPRNKKAERVLRLVKYCEEKCVLATRSGDTHAYCIPLSTPMSLERTPMPEEKQLSTMMSSLHGSINTTWRVVDPTQGALPPLLEEVPQPIEDVLTTWMASWEGKRRIETVLQKLNTDTKMSLTEKDSEISHLKSAIESYKHKLRQGTEIDTPPTRPPRSAPADSMMLGQSNPARPPRPAPALSTLTALDRRAPLSEPTFILKPPPVSTPQTETDDGSISDEYEYVSKVQSFLDKSSRDEEQKKVTIDDEMYNLKLKTEYDDLWNKYNTIKEKNIKLQDEKKMLVEKIEWLQHQVDDSEDYTMVSDYAKSPSKRRDNYVKITSSKPVDSKLQDTKHEKVQVPVSPVTTKDSLPVKEPRPAVPTRTNSRTSLKGNNPPVPARRVSIDHTAATKSTKENITTPKTQEIHFKPAAPAKPAKPSTPTPKAIPPAGPIFSPTPDDTEPASLQVPTPSIETSSNVHSGLTREEVGSFLIACNLGQYSEAFIKDDVTGELLLALDEQIMIEELGLSRLHARKLSIVLKKHKSL